MKYELPAGCWVNADGNVALPHGLVIGNLYRGWKKHISAFLQEKRDMVVGDVFRTAMMEDMWLSPHIFFYDTEEEARSELLRIGARIERDFEQSTAFLHDWGSAAPYGPLSIAIVIAEFVLPPISERSLVIVRTPRVPPELSET